MASHFNNTRAALRVVALVFVAYLTMLSTAAAHQGPPFPIIMDEPLGDYIVQVWTDPDIGEARFYVILETPEGDPPSTAPTVSMWAEPINKRLDRVDYEAHPQDLRNRMQFESKPYFDIQDMWNVGFVITPPGGSPLELTTEVESTPPGLGPWDLAIYLFPFLLFGGLWLLGIVRRRRMAAQMRREPTPANPDEVHDPQQFAESD